MSVQVVSGLENRYEAAWREGEAATVAAVSAMNLAVVSLVEAIGRLIADEGWYGVGIGSVEQWVGWKANLSKHRAEGLTLIARRREELPACWGLFAEGRLTEDAMVRIVRRVPARNDRQVAELAPNTTIAQLARALSCLPELPQPDEKPAPAEGPERYLRTRTRRDGWGEGEFALPPDEMALVLAGLTAARDAEFRDRHDLAPDAEGTPAQLREVSWADALVRMSSEACDALDATFGRTGHRGDRNQIVLHQHLENDGTFGAGRLHLAGFVSDPVARFLACDAQVIVAAYRNGQLLGINPSERTPNRRVRRYIEHRDGGCAHPLCVQKRWLHIHHIQHWEDDGLTIPSNLLALCPRHHRALHHSDFTIAGDPETGTVTFTDHHGRRIEPPPLGANPLPPPPQPTQPTQPTYVPPCGERFQTRFFAWN